MFKRQLRRQVCGTCGLECTHRRKVPDHLLHAILTAFSLGIWAISWIGVSIVTHYERWRCMRCGTIEGAAETERPATVQSVGGGLATAP